MEGRVAGCVDQIPRARSADLRDGPDRCLIEVAQAIAGNPFGADGAGATPDVVQAVVETVYADVPREVWPAAAMSVARPPAETGLTDDFLTQVRDAYAYALQIGTPPSPYIKHRLDEAGTPASIIAAAR